MGTLRKILTTGMGAALMTEGSLRNAISDIKITGLARDYLNRTLAAEVKKFLKHINLHQELQRALSGLTLHVEARVRIDSSGDQIKATVGQLKIKKA